MLTEEEVQQRLVEACRNLSPAENDYRIDDFIDNLMLTVLDFQMRTVAVERAMAHFKRSCRDDLRSLDDLERLLERFPDDQLGNTALAVHLLGYPLSESAAVSALQDVAKTLAIKAYELDWRIWEHQRRVGSG